METFLKLLEDESILHFYLRKCMKYLIIIFSAIAIYLKLHGEILLENIFIESTNSINLKFIFEELTSKRSFIPFIFLFIAYSIFSLIEIMIRFIFFGSTHYCSEKKFEKAYENLEQLKESKEVGMAEFLEFIYLIFKKRRMLYRLIHQDVKKLISEISSFKTPKDLDEWDNKIEANFYESLDKYVEMSIISFLMFYLFNSSLLNFLDVNSSIYSFSWYLLILYPLSRLILIIIITFYYRLAKLFITAGTKYLELKTQESNLG